jgi:DNA repair exonuclease SbcCD nuclease subunit
VKFIYITDTHLTYQSFRTRLDDPAQTGIDKLQWVLELALVNNIRMVVHGGDFFNAPAQQTYFLNRLIQLIQMYKRKGVILYSVVGNHDVHGINYDHYKYASIGVLTNTDTVQLLGDVELEDKTILRGLSAYEMVNAENRFDVSYLVVHGAVNEDIGERQGIINGVPVEGGIYYTSKQLKDIFPNLRGILWGHLHHETAVTRTLEDLLLVNPGSLMRVSTAEENNRIPKVAYVDTAANTAMLHTLAIAQPYQLVFNLTAKVLKKASELEVSKFLSMISSSVVSSVSLMDIVQELLDKLPPNDRTYIKADLMEQGFVFDEKPVERVEIKE